MKDPVTDLADRLALLRVRYEVAFQAPHINPPGGPVQPLATALAVGLEAGTELALNMVRAVVDPAETDTSEFWGTPLGRLMFTAGAYRGEACTQAVAAAVLGCSRQWVSAMVAEGKLTPVNGRNVPSDEVREVLKARAARLVDIPVNRV
jgi:hypothetical protein